MVFLYGVGLRRGYRKMGGYRTASAASSGRQYLNGVSDSYTSVYTFYIDDHKSGSLDYLNKRSVYERKIWNNTVDQPPAFSLRQLCKNMNLVKPSLPGD